MKKTPKQIVDSYIPKKPNKIFNFIKGVYFLLYCHKKHVSFIYNFDKKELKQKQFLMLADHSSREQFYYTMGGIPFVPMNPMVSYQNFFQKSTFKIVRKMGCIPKFLFINDFKAVKNVLNLKNKGCNILIYPEGIQSDVGVNQPINPTTVKLIKKIGLDVYLCLSNGAYLATNRYNKQKCCGKIEITYSKLFTKEEIETLSEEEIYLKLRDNFKYNDMKWNKDKQFSYVGKMPHAYGIDKLLYHCPKCHKEFKMHVEGENLICDCGNTIHIDDKYNITPIKDSILPYERLDQWFNDQRKLVKKEIEKKDFKYEFDCELIDIKSDKLTEKHFENVGVGHVTIDKDYMVYEGTKNGENVFYKFDLQVLPSAPFVAGQEAEFYYNNQYYSFHPLENPNQVVKIMMIVQELHNKKDPLWNKAFEDVSYED